MLKQALLLGFVLLTIAGCATSSRYVGYTSQRFTPKTPYYNVTVYPVTQIQAVRAPYYVIGRVSVEGFASNGVSPEGLTKRAQVIAQKRGADAIINARTEEFYYFGDELLRFKGDLIVYTPAAAK